MPPAAVGRTLECTTESGSEQADAAGAGACRNLARDNAVYERKTCHCVVLAPRVDALRNAMSGLWSQLCCSISDRISKRTFELQPLPFHVNLDVVYSEFAGKRSDRMLKVSLVILERVTTRCGSAWYSRCSHRSSYNVRPALSTCPLTSIGSIFVLIDLRDAGGAAIADLLLRAVDVEDAELLETLASAAYERSWEKLHCGSWKEVSPVWRQAFGLASVLQASCLLRHEQPFKCLRMLDMVPSRGVMNEI